MDSVGLVVGSKGNTVEVQVEGDSVEVGSILRLGEAYGIVAGMYYKEDDKIGSKHRLIADVHIFGVLKDGDIHRVKKPIPPYVKAEFASKEELERVLGTDDAISIGTVYGTKARALLDAGEYDRHIAILASTGAGKSYTAANLVAELASLGLPVIIVDTHGEYATLVGKLAEKSGISVQVLTIRYERAGFQKLKIPVANLEPSDFHHFMVNITEPQESAISTILERLDGRDYTIDDMIKECAKLDPNRVHETTIAALHRKLTSLKRSFANVFDKLGTDIAGLVAPKQVTIIDASLAPQGVRRSVVSYIANELLRGRVNEVLDIGDFRIRHPLILLVEEAHNYAGADLSHSCKSQLSRVASEGRKFGVGLCVISQKPSKIDEEILSQCNTGIYMHITNPRDKEHIKKSFECINEEIISDLDSLDVGECIIAGAMLDIPFLMCKVDKIELKKDKKSKFEFKTKTEVKQARGDYV